MTSKTSTTFQLAALVAGLASLSGCTMLVRAAKGELTPLGATQATSSDVRSKAGTVAETTDPKTFEIAFTSLTSVYLYKCMESPTLVPKEGNSEIREDAGEALVAAMKERAAAFGLDDPTLDAGGSAVASLDGRMTKCDADKRGKQDPTGRFAEAVALAQREGRTTYLNDLASALNGELDAALAQDGRAVRQWAETTCGSRLPRWSYCVPRAVEALHAQGKWADITNEFATQRDEEAKKVLPTLATNRGQDAIVGEVREYMMSGKATAEVDSAGLDVLADFLAANGVWGSCEDRKGLIKASLTSDNGRVGLWGLERIVTDSCRNFDDDIIKALGSDSPSVRTKAAWATGELKIQKAKKHVDRLRYSDPYMDEGCWCRPVRDAASNAYNKLELAGG